MPFELSRSPPRVPQAQANRIAPGATAVSSRTTVAQAYGDGTAHLLPTHVAPVANTGGRSMPAAVQRKMEAALGSNFSDVRIHVGPEAASIGALAFTQGSHVYFAPGQYNPTTPHGQRLLGHELTHVVQQRAGRVRSPYSHGVAIVHDRRLEAEADRGGLRAASHRFETSSGGARPTFGDQKPPVPSPPVQRKAQPVRHSQPRTTPSTAVMQRHTGLPSYVSNATTTGKISMVPRSIVETENIAETTYVRLYQTVYAPVEKGGYKDVQQTDTGRVRIRGSGDAWINAGRPLRAFHYVRTYTSQGMERRQQQTKLFRFGKSDFESVPKIRRAHGQPIIRSFLVPWAVYEELTTTAISEGQVKALGKTFALSVDKSKAPDQYLIREADVKKLRQHARPGSLVSYVPDGTEHEYTETMHGTVKPMSELRGKLGMPETDRFLPPTTPDHEMLSPDEQARRGKELSDLYDLSWFYERPEDVPSYARHLKVADFQRSHAIRQEFQRQKLKNMHRLQDLTWKYIGKTKWPSSKLERDKLRAEVAAAANFAVIPSLLKDNYYEATARMHGGTKSEYTGKPLSSWTLKQNFGVTDLEEPPPPLPTINTKLQRNLKGLFQKRKPAHATRLFDETISELQQALAEENPEALKDLTKFAFSLANAKIKTC